MNRAEQQTTENTCPNAERESKLIERAKKERRILVYSSENITLLSAYEAAFAKRYPFVKVEYWRAGGDRVGARVMTESNAGKLQGDLVGLAFDVANEIKAKGILARYASPERKAYPDMFKDADGYFTPTNLIHAIIGYNTKLASAREVPKDYPDLLNPSWGAFISSRRRAVCPRTKRVSSSPFPPWGSRRPRRPCRSVSRCGESSPSFQAPPSFPWLPFPAPNRARRSKT